VISSELKRTVGAEKKRSEEEEEGRKENTAFMYLQG